MSAMPEAYRRRAAAHAELPGIYSDGVPHLQLATDAGITAVDRDGTTSSELDGRHTSAMTRRGDDVYALADDGRAVVRRDASGSWSDVVAIDGPKGRSLLAQPGGAWVGTFDATLIRVVGSDAANVEGFDKVEGRDTWHAVGSKNPYVRSLTMTADSRAILANVHVGGIPRSGNNGTTWKPTIDVEADVHQVRAHPTDPNLVLAAAAVGLCVSKDAGVTWETTTDGMHATYSRAVAFTREAAIVSASDGPRTERSKVYRWPVSGGPLEACTKGLPEWLAGNVDSGCIDAADETVAFADAKKVYVSDDGGASWSEITDVDNRVDAIALVPA
jgi:hypothetical protein